MVVPIWQIWRLADPDFRPRIVEWREFGDRLGVAIEEIISGIKPAKQALDEAAADVRELFKKNRAT